MLPSKENEVAANEAAGKAKSGGVVEQELYQPTSSENFATFWSGLALRISTRRVLIVGPYAGEFGHEIMDFQSFVRGFRRKYREIHVITFPGREPLYRGCIVHSHGFDLRTAGYHYGRISHAEIQQYAHAFAQRHKLRDYDLFSTVHLRTPWHRRLLFRQEHEVIQPLVPIQPNRKVVFHFRQVEKAGPDKTRNYRADLVARTCELCLKAGMEVACIGHPQYSSCPTGCEDYRTEDLEQTVARISACRLVVGELSGPLHLAQYCGKPVAIWAPGPDRIAYVFKRNPFNVPVFVVRDDTTNPPPEEVVAAIKYAVGELTGGSARLAN